MIAQLEHDGFENLAVRLRLTGVINDIDSDRLVWWWWWWWWPLYIKIQDNTQV